MSGFVVQGWCPGALRPMMSGDGLVVRVRPPGGRLTAAQVAGIAAAAQAHGNGLIDLSNRANVQLRGVRAESHGDLIADLRALGLIDADPEAEARRNILVTPFADARTDALAARLATALPQMPALPRKFGFALDCGPAPVMAGTPADIRFERDAAGGLVLRCAGLDLGAPVDEAEAVEAAVELAQWFVDAGGVRDVQMGLGRMAALIATGARPTGRLAARTASAAPLSPPAPGLLPEGALVGFEFGQAVAETFGALARFGALRVTPWRMVLIEGQGAMPDLPGLITDPDDPLRRVVACTGAPGCPQAHAATRPLARALAPELPLGALLHVSGCAKGCALPARAPLTLVATPEGFDLIVEGQATDTPRLRALDTQQFPDLAEFFDVL